MKKQATLFLLVLVLGISMLNFWWGLVQFSGSSAVVMDQTGDIRYRIKNFFLKDGSGRIFNLGGDLSCPNKDYVWDRSEWFSGEKGLTNFTLSFVDSQYGVSDIHFVNAGGNRPFPFQASARGTIKELSISQNVTLECDIFLEQFQHTDCILRLALVVHLKEENIYLEADLKDSPKAVAIMPFDSPHCKEDILTDLPMNQWVHVSCNFTEWARRFGIENGTISSVYLVVEQIS